MRRSTTRIACPGREPRQASKLQLSRLRGVERLEGGSFRSVEHEALADPIKGDRPCVVVGDHLLLFVGAILLLVDDDEAEGGKRQEKGRPGPDHDARLPTPRALPDASPFALARGAVVELDLALHAAAKVRGELPGEKDLRRKDEGASSRGEGLAHELGVRVPAVLPHQEDSTRAGETIRPARFPVSGDGRPLVWASRRGNDFAHKAGSHEPFEGGADRAERGSDFPFRGRARHREEEAQDGRLAGSAAREGFESSGDLPEALRHGKDAAPLLARAPREHPVHRKAEGGEVALGHANAEEEGLRREGRTL